jgi:sigma-B regulation protein RsbU (phosphoserine phosphatase)
MDDRTAGLQADFENLFEHSVVGNLILSPSGVITRANARVAGWLGQTPDELVGKRLSDLLTVGGKIYLETHLTPMLRMQGEFEEVMVEMRTRDGSKLPVLINGIEQRSADGKPAFSRLAVMRASSRMNYEQNLRQGRAEAREALASAEGTLLGERETSALREQFIAVLGHDLRNPLAAIDSGMRAVSRSPLDDKQVHIISLVQASIRRMAGLIDDIMDFARGRLGGGIQVKIEETDLDAVLRHVIEELAAAHPERTIEIALQLSPSITCDGPKIAQLASNLLANAITHGSADDAITIAAATTETGFTLSVANGGTPIPPDAVERLFEPFTRNPDDSKQGLGLGLYIASEIAKAHGGSLEVASNDATTVFTLRVGE